MALFRQGKYSASYSAASEAHALAVRLREPPIELRATMLLGHHHFASGDLPRCIEIYRKCLATAHALDDNLNIAANISNLGDVLRDYGDFDESRALIEEAIARYGALGRALNESIAWAHLCELEFETGNLEARSRAVCGLGNASVAANHAYGKHRHAMFSLEIDVQSGRRRDDLIAALATLEDSALPSFRALTAMHAARILRTVGFVDQARATLEIADANATTQPVLRAHIALERARLCPSGAWPDEAATRFRHVGAHARVT